MLSRWALRLVLAVWVVAGPVAWAGSAAANPFDPGDPCAVDATSVECEQWLRDPGQPPEPDAPVCTYPRMTDQQIEMLRFRGIAVSAPPAPVNRPRPVEVPCSLPERGGWIGGQLGCWVAPVGGDHRPPQEPFLHIQTLYEADPGPQGGRWYAASCIGLLGADWPTEPIWLNAPPAASVDPSQVALRALARITLRAPQLRLIPPVAGSVPLGMPVWLAVGESTQAWGPVEDGPVCEGPVCVWISARVSHVDWNVGDGSDPIRCTRDQNMLWRPGMDPLAPGSACHHIYTEPSRSQPGGRYRVTATTSFRVDWSGAGQSGSFVDITGACGAGGAGACQTSTAVRVDEIQVLVTR
jgi:hypothetical protein